MAMKIDGSYDRSYDRSALDYAQRLEEEQRPDREEMVAEFQRTGEASGNGVNVTEGAPVPRDEYISSEKAGKRPSGLYRLGQDEDGRPKVFYDNPRKSDRADGKGKPEAGGADPEESEEKCVGNTDKVDREIRQLKEKKQQLEQQIGTASGDEGKVRELERKLAQVENELSRKDNDTYRRRNTSFVSA